MSSEFFTRAVVGGNDLPRSQVSMKLNNIGRGALASILSLAVGLGVTACSRDYTLAYVYVTTSHPLSASSSTDGGVSAYAVDYQSGALVPLADSPIPAGKNPVAIVTSPAGANGQFIYVINRDDSSVMEFAIGTDGKRVEIVECPVEALEARPAKLAHGFGMAIAVLQQEVARLEEGIRSVHHRSRRLMQEAS